MSKWTVKREGMRVKSMAKTIRRKPNWDGRKPFSEMSAAEKIREARMAIERIRSSPAWHTWHAREIPDEAIANWESTLRGLGVEP